MQYVITVDSDEVGKGDRRELDRTIRETAHIFALLTGTKVEVEVHEENIFGAAGSEDETPQQEVRHA